VSDAGSLVSRAVLDAGVRFDENLRTGLEDWDFWLQAAGKGFRGRHAADTGFQYRRRPESMLRTTARHQDAVTGYLQRKHRQWATARRCVDLEHSEAPRYAFLDPETAKAYLFTDPRDRARSMPLDAFVQRAAVYATNEAFRSLPAYVLAGHVSVLDALEAERTLVGIVWQMQRTCAESGWSSRNHLAMASLTALVSDQGRASTPEAGVETRLLTQFGETLRQSSVPRTLRMASTGRTKPSLTESLARWLDSGPLFPLASRGRRVGLLTSDGRTDAILRQFSSPGWTRHLFLHSDGDVSPSGAEAVDTITTVPPVAELTDGYRRYLGNPMPETGPVDHLVDALCTMDVVLIYGITAALPSCGLLRERGCKVVFVPGDSVIEEWDGRPQALTAALAYEHALDGVVPSSAHAAQRLVSYGFPAAKLMDTAQLSRA
jgi:hypothetical protein